MVAAAEIFGMPPLCDLKYAIQLSNKDKSFDFVFWSNPTFDALPALRPNAFNVVAMYHFKQNERTVKTK